MKLILAAAALMSLTGTARFEYDCPKADSRIMASYAKLIPFTEREKQGYRFRNGKIVVPPLFDEARPLFRMRKAWQSCQINLENGDRSETMLLTRGYHVAPVRKGCTWHLLMINPCDRYAPGGIGSSDGLFPCSLTLRADNPQKFETREGYLDLDGNFIDPGRMFQYRITKTGIFSDGLAFISVDDPDRSLRYATLIIDNRMNIIALLKSGHMFQKAVRPFREGRALILTNRRIGCAGTWTEFYGYLDRSGKTVIEPEFLKAESFHRGMARVTFIRKKYETANSCYASCCWYGMAPLWLISGWVPSRACHDEKHRLFRNDRAAMYGIIDTAGRVVHSSPDPGEIDHYLRKKHPGWIDERGKR